MATRLRSRLIVVVVAWACVLPLRDGNAASPRGGQQVYFVPIGIGGSLQRLHNTAEYFREALALDVIVAAGIEPAAAAFNPARRQYVAERLADHLAQMRAGTVPASATVIGITDADMYMAGYPRWRFVFSYRKDSKGTAVVSYARMDPSNFGEARDEDLLQARLRKMVAKDIGILVYGLRATNDPGSLLYNSVLGLEELDAMQEDFARAGMAPLRRR